MQQSHKYIKTNHSPGKLRGGITDEEAEHRARHTHITKRVEQIHKYLSIPDLPLFQDQTANHHVPGGEKKRTEPKEETTPRRSNPIPFSLLQTCVDIYSCSYSYSWQILNSKSVSKSSKDDPKSIPTPFSLTKYQETTTTRIRKTRPLVDDQHTISGRRNVMRRSRRK